MPQFAARRLRRLLTAADGATTHAAKGAAWEDVVAYVFTCIPGVSVPVRNVVNVAGSEEVDLGCLNVGAQSGLRGFPTFFLIEAKNWSGPVTSHHAAAFDGKVRRRGMTFAILVAANGITGDPGDRTAAHDIFEAALAEGRQIIVITRADIQNLRSARAIVTLIQLKFCQLAVTGSSIAPNP